jgi:hypothetical protein
MKNSCLTAILFLLAALAGAPAQEPQAVPVALRIMPWTPKQVQELMKAERSGPQYSLPSSPIRPLGLQTSVNLYPLLSNVPSQRNQGHCGNCWAWGSTAVMEIALNVQNGIYDRLSVQFINSCNPNKACCDAGGYDDVVNFYRSQGFAIPWSNTGAGWSSGDGTCSAAPCGSIATNPRYPISNISQYWVNTGADQVASIANVKSVLSQSQAMYFWIYLPTTAAWQAFDNFYFQQPESALWTNFYCGVPSDSGGGGHVVCCLGYYDDGASNRYWIMLNSWGPTSGRPTGLFHVGMNIDYTCNNGFDGYSIGYALAPRVTNQPVSLVCTQGNSAAFTIGTAPGTPLTYQWQHNGTNVSNSTRISGATSPTLTINNTTTADAGTYIVVLRYGPGSTNSAPATLTVLAPPAITAQPQSVGSCQGGGPGIFTISATGAPPPAYQWRWNGIPTSQTNSCIAYYLGNYWCVVSNQAGMVTSATVTLSISYPPAITNQLPPTAVVMQGSCTNLTIGATGTAPLAYFWHWNSLCTTGPATWSACSPGSYWCVVSNSCGLVTSTVMVLTLTNPSPGRFESISRQPNGDVNLSMSGTPGTNYTLLWTGDWLNWSNLGTLNSSNGEFQFTDGSASNATLRFYRMRLGP